MEDTSGPCCPKEGAPRPTPEPGGTPVLGGDQDTGVILSLKVKLPQGPHPLVIPTKLRDIHTLEAASKTTALAPMY